MSQHISKIGFGTWAIGGDSYGMTDDRESIRALEYAFENGISFYDTADLYGRGHSEKLLGKVFHNRRDSVVIASKVGYSLKKPDFQDFSKTYIIKSLEDSLTRLKTDYLDIYMLHSPSRLILERGDAFEILNVLRNQGKIKQIGVSLRSIDDGFFVINDNRFEVIQFIYNLLDQRAEEIELLNRLSPKKVLTIARIPLCFGFLSCKYSFNDFFPKNDHRNRWSLEQRNKWIKTSLIFKELFKKYGYNNMVNNAIKFCTSNNEISTVIPGMKTIAQVEENIKSILIPDFENALKDEIYTTYRANLCIPVVN